MANKFLNGIDTTSLSVNSQYSLPTSDGSNGQVLKTDGSGNVTFSDGADSGFVFYTVKNSTGSTIAKGTGVYASGTDGNSGHILISPMVADGTIEPKYFIGITKDAITNGSTGQVVHFGEIDQINTSTYTDGDVLWCDPSVNGGFTTTEPTGPNLKLAVAIVINASTNGKIRVRVQGNEGLHELHDVNISSQANGDLLQWNATSGVWENKTLASIADSRYVNVSGDTMTGELRLDGSVHIDTATGTQTLNLSRSGSTASQVVKIGVTDTTTDFLYIEDTTSEGNGNFGAYRFMLGGNDGESNIIPLRIDKEGIDVNGAITANSFVKNSGTSSQFLKADGSVDSSTYLTSESDTLNTVTSRGSTTSNVLYLGSDSATGGALAISDRYTGDDHIANIGFLQSSGGVYLGYGVKQDGSADWKSTFDNFEGERSFVKLDEDSFVMAWSAAQNTAVGTAVTMTDKFRFDLQTGRMSIGGHTPNHMLHIKSDGSSSNRGIRIESTATGGYSEAVFDSDSGHFRIGVGGSTTGSSYNNLFYFYNLTNGKIAHIDAVGNMFMGNEISTGYLRVRSTSDASLTSTGHGIQVGDTAAQNIIIDNNEIMARNNGAAGTLYLQHSGGLTHISDTLQVDSTANFDGNVTVDAQIATTGGSTKDVLTQYVTIKDITSTDDYVLRYQSSDGTQVGYIGKISNFSGFTYQNANGHKFNNNVRLAAGANIDNKLIFDRTNTASGGDFNFIELGYNGSWSGNVNGLAAIEVNDGTGSIGKFGITYNGSKGVFTVTNLYNAATYGASGDVFTVAGDGNATISNNLTLKNLYTNNTVYFDRSGSGNYENFIRSQNYPSEGYTSAASKYWLEYNTKGGHHFVVNSDGGAGGAENDYDDFTIWQGAVDGDRLFSVSNVGNTNIYNKLSVTSSTIAASFTSGDGGYTSVRFDGDAGATVGSLTTHDGLVYIGSENTNGTGSNGEIRIDPFGGNILTLSNGRAALGTANPRARLEVFGENFAVTNSGRSVGGIHVASDSNDGAGTYSGGISFAGSGSGAAAISGVQGTADGDTQGLAFFTHGSSTGANDSAEAMRLHYNGDLEVFNTLTAGAVRGAVGTSYDGTPNGTTFSHTLADTIGSGRVVNFDGNGDRPSVWWSNGNNAVGAIDGLNGTNGLTFWVNSSGGSWQRNFYIDTDYTEFERKTVFDSTVSIGTTDSTYGLNVSTTSIFQDTSLHKHYQSVSVGAATTPVNSAGWYKIGKIDSRGGGIIHLSFTGGNYTPVTYEIKYYKNWTDNTTLKLEQYGSSQWITAARIRLDSSDSKYYIEVYCTSNGNGLQFNVYHTKMLGYNASGTVYTGALSAGSASGTTYSELNFQPYGTTVQALKSGSIFSDEIGIGTTNINALAKLEVSGHIMSSGNSTILMLNNTGGTPQNWWVGQDISGNNDGKFYVFNATSAGNPLTIDKSNNVGINQTSPAEKLHVSGGRLRVDGGEVLVNTSVTGVGWLTIQPTTNTFGQYAINVINSSGGSYFNVRGDGTLLSPTGRYGDDTTSGNGIQFYDAYQDGNSAYYHTPRLLAGTNDGSTGGVDEADVGLLVHNRHGANNTWAKIALGGREADGAGNTVSWAGIAARKDSGTAGSWARGQLYFWVKDNATAREAAYYDYDGAYKGNYLHVLDSGAQIREGLNLMRSLGAKSGISFYNDSYYNWQIYMSPAGATSAGANGNLTAPSGLSSVTSWALRSRMEGVSTYGWLWETGGSGGGGATASPKMELGATTGTLRVTGDVIAYASDERLKTNVKPIENAVEKVKQISGVTYDWVDNIEDEYDFHPNSKHEAGVLAQEIEKVLPEAVMTAPMNAPYTAKTGVDHEFKTVKYERIVPLLIEAIKEQQKQIDELKAIINGSA